jgi:hypothetical protein
MGREKRPEGLGHERLIRLFLQLVPQAFSTEQESGCGNGNDQAQEGRRLAEEYGPPLRLTKKSFGIEAKSEDDDFAQEKNY